MKRILLLFTLASAFSLSAQNMVQMQQLPLLISPSFTGSDTSGRVILAMQKYGQKSATYMLLDDQAREGYFASFDMRNGAKTKAFGGYVGYTKVDNTSGDNLLNRAFPFHREYTGYYANQTHLGMEKLEVGLSYVPVFWELSLVDKNKKWNLIPAFLLTYSHHNTQLDHHDYQGADFEYLTSMNYVGWKDSVTETKKLRFDRVSLGGSIMLKGERLFFSYQMAVRYDQVALNVANDQMRANNQGFYTSSSFDESYRKGYLQFANYIAFGMYFPKNPSSWIQFNPIIMSSFILSPVNDKEGYGKREPSYDHGDFFSPTLHRMSLNLRVKKFLVGYNGGVNGQSGPVAHYYVGYKARKMTVTAGIVNSDIYNASLQYNFR